MIGNFPGGRLWIGRRISWEEFRLRTERRFSDLTLQFVRALRDAADLEGALGYLPGQDVWVAAGRSASAVRALCWKIQRGLGCRSKSRNLTHKHKYLLHMA